jgi:hypothetical protein
MSSVLGHVSCSVFGGVCKQLLQMYHVSCFLWHASLSTFCVLYLPPLFHCVDAKHTPWPIYHEPSCSSTQVHCCCFPWCFPVQEMHIELRSQLGTTVRGTLVHLQMVGPRRMICRLCRASRASVTLHALQPALLLQCHCSW